MREILGDIDRWRAAGHAVVVARVVDIDGSGPRLPGAAMAVNDEGEVAGSVSGGCVEGAVVEEAIAVMASGDRRVVSFGYSDNDAFAVGLTCGGTVHLYLEPLDAPFYDWLQYAIRTGRPVALATVIDGHPLGAKLLVADDAAADVIGTLDDADLDRVVARDARGELEAGTNTVRHYGPHGQAGEEVVSVFVESFAPPPRMYIFGAVDFTAALVNVAKVLGYRVTVCDARRAKRFTTRQRFPRADEVIVDWPHRLLETVGRTLGPRDAICVLTHDLKFDVPAIVAALGSDVGYLGVMGSRRTHADRVVRLREEGVTDEQLERIMAPIGLDLGARTPEETAIAVCAEIIALRTGREAPSLRNTDGPIHR